MMNYEKMLFTCIPYKQNISKTFKIVYAEGFIKIISIF